MKPPHLFACLAMAASPLAAQPLGTQQVAGSALRGNETVVFFGDSITQSGAQPGGYVSLVSEAVASAYPGVGIKVIGAGVGGNKVPDLVKRLDRDVLSQQPDVVVVYVGINDVWHWTKPHPVTNEKRVGTTAKDYESGLRELVTRIQEAGARVILCTPSVIGEAVDPGDDVNRRLEEYSAIARRVAGETDSQLLDLRKEFVGYLASYNPDRAQTGILTKDGVHLNDAGNQFVAKLMLGALQVGGVNGNLSARRGMESPKDLQLYLLIGQSNMAGRAPIPADARGPIESCFLLNDAGEWSPAANPLNQFSTVRKDLAMQQLGPGYSFAKRMIERTPGVSIGLIVNALGGSKIEQWERGQHCYEEAVKRVKVAEQSGMLRGILWHQGESNEKDGEYLAKLVTLVKDLRKDLGAPELPFVAGQINDVELINAQIARLPAELAHTGFVSSEGLTAQDRWHFNTASALEMGKRYAHEMLKLEAGTPSRTGPAR